MIKAKVCTYIVAHNYLCCYYYSNVLATKEDLASVVQYEDLPSSSSSKQKLPSFWVPALTPDAKPTEIKKPVCFKSSL